MEKEQEDRQEKKTVKAAEQAAEQAAAQQPEETSKAEKDAGRQEPGDDVQVKLKKTEDELKKGQDELKKSQEELKKQKELLLRTAAEYDNYRKRSEREKSAVYADATSAAVAEFLSVADNLERALAQKDCGVEDLRKGVEMVETQLKGALAKLGVTEMGAVGDVFNPDLHNAVSHVEDENAGDNTIVQVFQKGYQMGDKVVRHAMVQVAN